MRVTELTNSAPLEVSFEQLAADHRPEWKGRHAVAVLTCALADSDAWWEHVEQVRAGRDALDVAGAYGTRGRAQVIAHLIERAASELDKNSARMRMLNTGLVPWFADEPSPTPSRRFDDRYRRRLVLGAECIARRGAGLCLSCGELPGQRPPNHALRDYCRGCETAAGHVPRADERERAIRELFDAARRVIR